MASRTQQTDNKRKAKARKQGSDRKKGLESQGTTRSEAEIFGNVLPR